MNRFTPDAMLGLERPWYVEDPDPVFERNRPLDQAAIDRPRKPPTAADILAQQRQEWPQYAGIRRPLDDAFWDRVGAGMAIVLVLAVCVAIYLAVRGGVIR